MNDAPHFRGAGRRPVALRVRYQSGTALEHVGTTVDVGLRGAFIETTRPPSAGTHVTLFLSAPTAWEPLEIPCQVRWTSDGTDGRPPGFGVRFDELRGGQSNALYQLLQTIDFEGEP